MSFIKRTTSYVAAASLVAAGLILAGAPSARAETGPPQPYEEDDGGIGTPIFGLIAIAGIATVAIWQGINDAKKKKEAEKQRVIEALKEVGIPVPEEAYKRYPHEFSGGMQQRALIAIALSCQPKILLADEPTTALDVTIQAQILELLNKINREHGTSIILVTHNLGVVAEFCDTIAVMYAGRMMEKGQTEKVISQPMHPYTRGLLACLPGLSEKKKIHPIPGRVPDLIELSPGCPFYPRCDAAMPECRGGDIPLKKVNGRLVRCLLY